MNKPSIPALKRNATTEQAMQNTMLRINKDAEALSVVKQSALGMFSTTARNLEKINDELMQSIVRLDHLSSFALSQKQEAERMVADNNAVIAKIREIIGE